MTTQETADRLVELCRQGQNMTAYDELFDGNAKAIEPEGLPDNVTEGIDNLRKKSEAWAADLAEMHSSSISDPIVAGNHFSISWNIDITTKSRGRMQMEEIAVYETNSEGKIVTERFFFALPPMG